MLADNMLFRAWGCLHPHEQERTATQLIASVGQSDYVSKLRHYYYLGRFRAIQSEDWRYQPASRLCMNLPPTAALEATDDFPAVLGIQRLG